MKDVQNQADDRNKKINKVGIRNLIIPIKIFDAKGNVRNTVADISIYTSLNEKVKGVNMSRYAELLHEVLEENTVSVDIVKKLLKQLLLRLSSKDSYVKLKFNYFVKKKAPVSEKEGYIHYNCILEGKYREDVGDSLFLTVQVPYTSCCPCSKEISSFGAHNQRSTADVTVELMQHDIIKIEELITVVERLASYDLYSVLKRSDEKFVTEQAYNNPKFVEDMARDISMVLDTLLDKKINDYVVVINHYESIHTHNAVAVVSAGRRLK